MWAEFIADYTGLTASASVGLTLACLAQGAPLQYTPAIYDQQIKAKRLSAPFEVILQGERTAVP